MINKMITEQDLHNLKEYFKMNKKRYNVYGTKESIDKISSMKFDNVELNYIVTDDLPIDLDRKIYIIEDDKPIKIKLDVE